MAKTLYVLAAVALIAMGFVLGVIGGKSATLGATSYDRSNLVGDVYQGMNSVLMMTGGVFVGPITSSNAVSLSGTVSATGASTFKCLKTYNGATTTTAYYLYVSGTSTLATTTKPSLCP